MTVEVLRVQDVSFVRVGRTLLDRVVLTVRAGEHWALLGPNGAGKTTLLNLCAAVTFPSGGHVEVLGHRLGTYDLRDLRRSIGFVNSRHPLRSDLEVEEIVLTGVTGSIETVPRWRPSDDELDRARRLIKLVGMDDPTSPRWTTMSQGERTRTLIARALMPDPPLLLLDEPSTGLDVAAREQLLSVLDEVRRGTPEVASVTVTHHFEELPSSTTHACLLHGGRVYAAGPVEQVLTSPRVSACFEHPIRVETRRGRWFASAEIDPPWLH